MPAETIIKLRRGTASQWTTANPVLAAGEMGVESNTNKSKFGDGTTAWNLLPYSLSDQAGDAPNSLKLIATRTAGFGGTYSSNDWLGIASVNYDVSLPENQLLFVVDINISELRPGTSVSNFTQTSGSIELVIADEIVIGGSFGAGTPIFTNSFYLQSPTSGKHGLSSSVSSFFLAPVGEGPFNDIGLLFYNSVPGPWSITGTYFVRVYEVYRD
jgi:hypothetical protein